MKGLGDGFFNIIQHRGVVLSAYVLYSGFRAAQYWLDPAQPEDIRMGATLSLGVYAALALFAWRRNTLAIWAMSASILFTGATSLIKAIGLSLTDPLNTIGANAFNLLAGSYFVMGGLIIFRSRRIKIVGIELLPQTPEEKKDGGEPPADGSPKA